MTPPVKKACIKCGNVGQREGPYCRTCMPLVPCPTCGHMIPWAHFRHPISPNHKCGYCRPKLEKRRILREEAYKRELERERQRQVDEARQEAIRELQQQADREKLESCTLDGVCSVFKAHHEILANDPERLKTEFLIKMTCGVDGLRKYKSKVKAGGE